MKTIGEIRAMFSGMLPQKKAEKKNIGGEKNDMEKSNGLYSTAEREKFVFGYDYNHNPLTLAMAAAEGDAIFKRVCEFTPSGRIAYDTICKIREEEYQAEAKRFKDGYSSGVIVLQ